MCHAWDPAERRTVQQLKGLANVCLAQGLDVEAVDSMRRGDSSSRHRNSGRVRTCLEDELFMLLIGISVGRWHSNTCDTQEDDDVLQ